MFEHNFNTYFVSPDVETASDIVNHLKELKVSEDQIGTVSKDSDIVLTELPETDLSDKSQLPEAMQRGALLGSGTGFLAGLLLTTFPVAGVTVGGAGIVAMTAGGTALGSWAAAMIGVSENSQLVKKFEKAIDAGNTLVLAHLTDGQTQQLRDETTFGKTMEAVESGKIH